MNRVALLLLSILLVGSASHASEETNELDRRARASFFEGKTAYLARQYRDAHDLLEKSMRLFDEGTAKQTDPKSIETWADNTKLLKRWIVLNACQEYSHSDDIEKVRISLGQRRAKAPHYESCLAFPEFPNLKSYALAQLEWMSAGRSGPRPEAPVNQLGTEKTQ